VMMFIVFFGIVISSCSSDDSDPSDQNTLTANAGADQTLEVGIVVRLDGSNSSASAGTTFNYEWEISSAPPTSTATLISANGATPSFTPNIAGVYVIQLTVANTDLRDTDTVTITVTEASTGITELGGTINQDMVLVNRIDTPGVADYCVTSDVNLQAIMTIEPGVEIHFEADLSFKVDDKGVLIAKGTSEDHIVFTAKNQSNPWRGIGFVLSDDVRNSMDYVDISYAGSDLISIIDRKAAVGLSSFSELAFTNSTITHSVAIGMFVEDDVELIAFENNRFENNAGRPLVLPASEVGKLDAASQFSTSNGDNTIEIHEGSIDAVEPITWTSFIDGTPYVVTDDIDIDSELTILPGAVFLIASNKGIKVSDSGILIAEGTQENMIQFTAKEIDKPWRGIGFILSDNQRNSLDYVEISYAGLDKISILERKAALGIASFSDVRVKNTKIIHSANYGMYIADDVEVIEFASNTFENNAKTPLIVSIESLHQLDAASKFGTTNGDDFIEVLGGTVDHTEEITWKSFDDATPYVVSGNIGIQSGVNITSKASFLMKSDTEIQINQNGFLSAKGESDAGRIKFTAFDTALPWRGIAFLTDNIRNELDFVEVSYAGSDFISILSQKANVGINSFDQAKITNSLINNSVAYGVVVDKDATINIDVETSNSFVNNVSGNVFIEN